VISGSGSAPASPPQSAPASPLGAEAAQWLAVHNRFRCMHGVSDVTWNDAVAASAQAWANHLTHLEHAASFQIKPPAGPAAENLAIGQGSLEQATTDWYNEVKDCESLPGCEKGVGGRPVGHFTPIVWKGAKEIGCGINRDLSIYVCRYKGGDTLTCDTPNVQGCYSSNVFAKQRQC